MHIYIKKSFCLLHSSNLSKSILFCIAVTSITARAHGAQRGRCSRVPKLIEKEELNNLYVSVTDQSSRTQSYEGTDLRTVLVSIFGLTAVLAREARSSGSCKVSISTSPEFIRR